MQNQDAQEITACSGNLQTLALLQAIKFPICLTI